MKREALNRDCIDHDFYKYDALNYSLRCLYITNTHLEPHFLFMYMRILFRFYQILNWRTFLTNESKILKLKLCNPG